MAPQADDLTAERAVCMECGMPCTPNEYHPFLACLAFKQCHNSETVRANMDGVRQQTRQEVLREASRVCSEWYKIDRTDIHTVAEMAEVLATTLDRLASEGGVGC